MHSLMMGSVIPIKCSISQRPRPHHPFLNASSPLFLLKFFSPTGDFSARGRESYPCQLAVSSLLPT